MPSKKLALNIGITQVSSTATGHESMTFVSLSFVSKLVLLFNFFPGFYNGGIWSSTRALLAKGHWLDQMNQYSRKSCPFLECIWAYEWNYLLLTNFCSNQTWFLDCQWKAHLEKHVRVGSACFQINVWFKEQYLPFQYISDGYMQSFVPEISHLEKYILILFY